MADFRGWSGLGLPVNGNARNYAGNRGGEAENAEKVDVLRGRGCRGETIGGRKDPAEGTQKEQPTSFSPQAKAKKDYGDDYKKIDGIEICHGSNVTPVIIPLVTVIVLTIPDFPSVKNVYVPDFAFSVADGSATKKQDANIPVNNKRTINHRFIV